jgi:hypothetical protein
MNEKIDILSHIRLRFNHDKVREYLFRHRPKQVYIRINMRSLTVMVEGVFGDVPHPIRLFHRAPSLAEAVIYARNFCRRYYSDIPVLEYNDNR